MGGLARDVVVSTHSKGNFDNCLENSIDRFSHFHEKMHSTFYHFEAHRNLPISFFKTNQPGMYGG
jgi:hypothetical protein